MDNFLEIRRNRPNWAEILAQAAPGLQRGVTAQSDAMSMLMPLLFKAQIERQMQREKLAQLPQILSQMGGMGRGQWKPTITSEGDLSLTPYTQAEMSAQEAATREPRLANVLNYIRSATSRGATFGGPEGGMAGGLSGMVRPERFTTPEEQTKIESALKTGIALRPKISQAKEKRKVEVEELGNQAQDLITLFKSGQEEGKKISGFGKTGPESRFAGRGASFLGMVGVPGYAYINVYNRKKKAFATVVAKAAGEVRPTDEDIVRFMGTLPDFNLSDKENNIVIDQLQKDIQSKGYKKVWQDRISGNVASLAKPKFNSQTQKLQLNKTTGKYRVVTR